MPVKKGIQIKSRKAKGRKLQNEVRDRLREIGIGFGLVEADIEGRPMGQAGTDLILTPAARKLMDLDIECKNQSALVVPTTFARHYSLYKATKALKVLFHTRNREEVLVTMRAEDFYKLLNDMLLHEQTLKMWEESQKESTFAAVPSTGVYWVGPKDNGD